MTTASEDLDFRRGLRFSCLRAPGLGEILHQLVEKLGFAEKVHQLVEKLGFAEKVHQLVEKLGFAEKVHQLVEKLGSLTFFTKLVKNLVFDEIAILGEEFCLDGSGDSMPRLVAQTGNQSLSVFASGRRRFALSAG